MTQCDLQQQQSTGKEFAWNILDALVVNSETNGQSYVCGKSSGSHGGEYKNDCLLER
jgi:hypothetical protein